MKPRPWSSPPTPGPSRATAPKPRVCSIGTATTDRAILGAVIGLASLAACREASSPRPVANSAAAAVTYAADVAPILFEHCVSCHRSGGPAPFSLFEYEEVRTRARLIAAVTRSRFMPPWLPDAGYGEFTGERRLTVQQRDTIGRWVDQGMLEGNPENLPPRPRFSEGWQLGEPDLTIKIPRPYTLRADGSDVWRNFVLPIPLSDTRFVKTVELRPGSARFVHHALIAVDETRSSRRRDDREADAGFDGMDFGEAHMPDGHLVGWTPGMLPFPGVEGMAWRLEPRTDLVLQLHMMPSGRPEVVEPVVGFHFADTVASGAAMYLLQLDADEALDIPAGEKAFVVTDTIELPVDVEVLAAYPHAHYLGKSVEGRARLPDGTERWLIRISDWNFNWQDVYRYTQPVSLPKGTQVTLRWTYDNSDGNVRNPNHPPKRVGAGNRSSDEMAHLQLQVRLQRAEHLATLQEAYYRHALRKAPANALNYYGLGNALLGQGQLADATRQYRAALAIDPRHTPTRLNLGAVLVEQGLADEAISHFRAALQVEPDSAGAHYNLGIAFEARNRLDESVRHYREALRLEPGFADAHNKLGQVLGSQGKLDEAIGQFREAVRLKPQFADAHNNLGAGLWLEGKPDEAISHFQRALEIDPDHADARENLVGALKNAPEAGGVRR